MIDCIYKVIMTPKKYSVFGLFIITTMAILASAPRIPAQGKAAPAFDGVADKALAAMKKQAEELDVKGVALVAFAEGDTVTSWTSKWSSWAI